MKHQDESMTALATKYVISNMGEDKLFPPIDDGNMGVSAYIASIKNAGTLLALAKDLHKGVPIAQTFVLHPTMHSVVVVVTSEDEPCLHLVVFDHARRNFTPITSINVPDLCGVFPKVFKDRIPSLAGEYPDWGDVMTALLSDGHYIDLGEEAAEKLWWT